MQGMWGKTFEGVGAGTVKISFGKPVKLPWLPPKIVENLKQAGVKYQSLEKTFIFDSAAQLRLLTKIGLPIELI